MSKLTDYLMIEKQIFLIGFHQEMILAKPGEALCKHSRLR